MSLIRTLVAAFLVFAAGAGWVMGTRPEEAMSNAEAWLDFVGLSSWGEGFTPVTDAYIQAGLYSAAALCFMALVASVFWRRAGNVGRRKPRRDFSDFDMPVFAAVEHMKQTVAHQWDSHDKAERDFWRRIHEQMRASRLRAIGAEVPGGTLRRISRKDLGKLTPVAMNVPESDIAPYGVRFDLLDEARLTESDSYRDPFPGVYDLRVRSKDLYRLWPQTRAQKGDGA